jgi:hypothetical protein
VRFPQPVLKTGPANATTLATGPIPAVALENIMNTLARIAVAAGLVAAGMTPAMSQTPLEPTPARIVIDCARPRLPAQHEVGALLDQHNLGQVYASRAALMAEARRACRRGPATVRQVAFEPVTVRPSPEQRVADHRRER